MECGNCQCFLKDPTPIQNDLHTGQCLLNPQTIRKAENDLCYQFIRKWTAEGDLAVTRVDVLFGAHTVGVLRRCKITTLQDLIDEGRTAVRTNGALDRNAIIEIERKLFDLGIRW